MIKLKKILEMYEEPNEIDANFDLEKDLQKLLSYSLQIPKSDINITPTNDGLDVKIENIQFKAYKPNDIKGHWQIKYGGKTIDTTDEKTYLDFIETIASEIKDDFYEFKRIVDDFDWTYEMSDDFRYVKQGWKDERALGELYKNLSDNLKEMAYDYFYKKTPYTNEIETFKDFNKKMELFSRRPI